jgi:proteasome lid subunit RPN8/RPN11
MIIIEKSAETIMNDDAIKAFPDECCGFMLGREDGAGNRVVSSVLPINNSARENRRRRFEISPRDYLKGEQHAMDHHVELLGIYHSHPNHPAIPSEHDRVAAQPWFSYVIISVGEDEVKDIRSWRLNSNSQFDEEEYSKRLINTNT